MKYQQLENLESGWKWKYLVKKHREGELITCYLEASAAKEAVNLLIEITYDFNITFHYSPSASTY